MIAIVDSVNMLLSQKSKWFKKYSRLFSVQFQLCDLFDLYLDNDAYLVHYTYCKS